MCRRSELESLAFLFRTRVDPLEDDWHFAGSEAEQELERELEIGDFKHDIEKDDL